MLTEGSRSSIWAEKPQSRPCPRGLAIPRARPLSLPLFQKGSLYPRAVGWGSLGRWEESRGLMEGDGRVSRDKPIDEKACIKGKAQRTQTLRTAGCPLMWCISATGGKFKPQHSQGPYFSEETVLGRWGPGWGLMDPTQHHSESATSETDHAGFLLPTIQPAVVSLLCVHRELTSPL